MKLVIIGYGKMGKTIERIAVEQGHEVVGAIDIDTSPETKAKFYASAEVGIEFSHPSAAFDNIMEALDHGLAIVSGTTGWIERITEVHSKVSDKKGAFFYASNYSIGVNLFWMINKKLASLMNDYTDYDVSMEEIHHIHKKDEPSGTALTTANQILDAVDRKTTWSLEKTQVENEIHINAKREGEVFGIHKVKYKSELDTIELYHEAHTRDGFAQGAITAARWLIGKKGNFGMKELLGL